MGDRNLLVQGTTGQGGQKEDIDAARQGTGSGQEEDKVMKTAAQFFGKDLLRFMNVKGEIDRVAPTEYVHLDMRRLEDDFNWVLKRELVNGGSIYRVEVARLKDRDSDKVIRKLERKIQKGQVIKRRDVFSLLLTPLMSGKMDIGERICRSMDILQRESLGIKKEDIKWMQSVLYALAVKFLKREELERVKGRIGMTILGQMLFQDGVEKGVKKGLEQGIQALILDNLEEGTAKKR